jgi:hypothetical protein
MLKSILVFAISIAVFCAQVELCYEAEYIDLMTGQAYPVDDEITGTKECEVPLGPIVQD